MKSEFRGFQNSVRRCKLVAATSQHLSQMKGCENGLGVDRHMMGLAITAIHENGTDAMPEIFTDPAFVKRSVVG